MSTETTGQGARVAPERSAAGTARAAMLLLAQRKLPPTPENYALAWAKAGGLAGAASLTHAGNRLAKHPARGADCVTSSGWWPS